MIGQQIGAYEVLSKLGEGGMGEVYRAHDTKLHRDVAIKVLPQAVATDAERLKRFEREAQLLAALNHPNIAQLFGVEESGPVRALVMELVPGQTLQELMRSGTRIPIPETLEIARQIADALEAAHDQGIIHRDLKPANVKIRPDGTVKLLDFGLAKVLGGEADSDRANSPTLTTATRIGTILGTAAYMSPEQAVGKAADRRSDVWAFGVVLMEMLTGRPLFDGETVSHVLAEVIKTDPDFSALPPETPVPIRRLLKRCLEKDRRRRLADASTLRLEIEDVLGGREAPEAVARTPEPAARPRGALATWLPWTITAIAAALAIVIWTLSRQAPPAAAPPSVRIIADLGADVVLGAAAFGSDVAVSPDGTTLAFAARPRAAAASAPTQLYVRPLGDVAARPLPGTDDATSPFFSPDGRWIAFFAAGKLKKAAVDGTVVGVICDATTSGGGDWSDDGTMVFHPESSLMRGLGLSRVPENGGRPVEFVKLEAGVLRWPQALPGRRGVLYTAGPMVMGSTGVFNRANIAVKASGASEAKVVQAGGYYGRYVPSGHLVFMRDDALFAVPFDLNRLEVVGTPAPVMKGIRSNASTGGAQFAVSRSGTLVYVPGSSHAVVRPERPVVWMHRSGQISPLRPTPSVWGEVEVSPDGQRLAMLIAPSDSSSADIWVYEWARDTLVRLTNDTTMDALPIWSPDSRRIVFGSRRAPDATVSNLYMMRADGTGGIQRLTESSVTQLPDAFDPSGKWLAYHEGGLGTGQQRILVLPLDGDDASGWRPGQSRVFAEGAAVMAHMAISPDGKWAAYSSNESGALQVYVERFPSGGQRVLVSSGAGTNPVWSSTKPELLFAAFGTPQDPGRRIMAVGYSTTGGMFSPGKPSLWSEGRFGNPPVGTYGGVFALHPDGQRVAVAPFVPPVAAPPSDRFGVVISFFDELRRITAAK